MCCNYCYYFVQCTKAKKTSKKCCEDCAEYEYCPFINDGKGEKKGREYEPVIPELEENEEELDADIIEDEEI